MRNPFRCFTSSTGGIRLVAMIYIRSPSSLTRVRGIQFERGMDICHETVRFWWNAGRSWTRAVAPAPLPDRAVAHARQVQAGVRDLGDRPGLHLQWNAAVGSTYATTGVAGQGVADFLADPGHAAGFNEGMSEAVEDLAVVRNATTAAVIPPPT